MPYITGLALDDFQIESMIGDGAFATVYSALDSAGTRRAIKVAKIEGGDGGGTGFYQSLALERLTHGFGEFQPHSSELLERQFQLLSSITNQHLVKAIERKSIAGLDLLILEFVEGRTLRDLIIKDEARIDHVKQVAIAVQNLSANSAWKLHGDIKPENVILKPDGTAVLIDPGFYGELLRADGKLVRCSITTPQYYPFVNADDLFAIGLVLWEVATRQNLLGGRSESGTAPGPALKEQIEIAATTGNTFPAGLAAAHSPQSVNRNLSAEISSVVAKAARLKFNSDGTPDFDPGFANVDDLLVALNSLG